MSVKSSAEKINAISSHIYTLEPETEIIRPVLDAFTHLAHQHFGSDLVACYALGSIAHGGFSSVSSDVDLAIIFSNICKKESVKIISLIQKKLQQSKIPFAEKVSLYYGSIDSINARDTSSTRFPAYDKVDLILHGKLLCGTDVRTSIVQPSRQEIEIEGAKVFLRHFDNSLAIKEIAHMVMLLDKNDFGHMSKLILLPVRFIFSVKTNSILANNREAVHYFIHSGYDNDLAKLVQWAFDVRDNKHLIFPASSLLDGVISIYKEFIDIYCDRLLSYKENDLAEKLQKWKNKLSKNK